MKGLRKARKRQATHPRYGAAPRKSGSRLWVRYVIRCSETCDRHRCYSVGVGSCSPPGKKPMRKVIASLIAALVLTFTGAMVGGRAQAAAIAPEGLGTAGDERSLQSIRFSSFIAADATAGIGTDGEVRAGIGAVMNGAAVLAGVVPLGGMAGADHLGRQSVRRRDQIVRE
jgi:hypothetical protein